MTTPPRRSFLKIREKFSKSQPLAFPVPCKQMGIGNEMIFDIQGAPPLGRGAGKREMPKKGESIDIGMNIK
jgi:hypothetical protein